MAPCILLAFEKFSVVVKLPVKYSQSKLQFFYLLNRFFFLPSHDLVPFR